MIEVYHFRGPMEALDTYGDRRINLKAWSARLYQPVATVDGTDLQLALRMTSGPQWARKPTPGLSILVPMNTDIRASMVGDVFKIGERLNFMGVQGWVDLTARS